jgi:hypothetical protein
VTTGGFCRWGGGYFSHVLWSEVGVTLQLVPRLVQRELRDLMNLIAALEQPAGRFVPQIMEAQVADSKNLACPSECRTNALGIARKDVLAGPRVRFDDGPGLGGVLEAALPSERIGVFQRHLSVPAPTDGRRSMRECPTLPVDNRCTTPDANNRRVARLATRLLAYFDRWHGES